MEPQCLYDLKPGQCSTVTGLNTEKSMRRRLMDLGLTPGTKVECLGRSPFGDPSAYLIRGAVIALRYKDCRNIFIQENKKSDIGGTKHGSLGKGGEINGSDT